MSTKISDLHTCLRFPSDRSVGVQHPGAGTLCWLTHPECPSAPAGWPEPTPTEYEHLEENATVQTKLTAREDCDEVLWCEKVHRCFNKILAKICDVLKKRNAYLMSKTIIKTASVDVLTSTQGSLWIKYVPTKGNGLGHYMLVKSHFFGIVQGVAHHCGAKDILHRLTQVRFIAYQGQSCVDIVLSNLTGGGKKKNIKRKG